MNKIYGVFYYAKSGDPVLLREFRSYKAALLHKLDMCEKMTDFNFCIMERIMTEWRPVNE